MNEQQPKKRGRPPLSSEEKAKRKPSKAGISATKAGGYASQKRYRENHKGEMYEPKVRIAQEYKSIFDNLLQTTGLSTTELFLSAVEEKYGVTLHKVVDKNNK